MCITFSTDVVTQKMKHKKRNYFLSTRYFAVFHSLSTWYRLYTDCW